MSVLVSLSSGDHFYVDANMDALIARLRSGVQYRERLVRIGGRMINPEQISQLQFVAEPPSIETPEKLED